MENTMKVQLTRSVVAAAKPRSVGDIILLSTQEARFLISRKLAKEYKGKAKAINEEVEQAKEPKE